MNFSRIVYILIALLSSLYIAQNSAAFALGFTDITERDWFNPIFQVIQTNSGNGVHLHIQGQMLTSNTQDCSQIKTRIKGTTMILLVMSRPFGKPKPLDLELDLPTGVDKVVFGKKRTEIWPDDAFAPKYSRLEQDMLDAAKKRFEIDYPAISFGDCVIGIVGSDTSPSADAANPGSRTIRVWHCFGAPNQGEPKTFFYQVSDKDLSVNLERAL